MKGMRKILAVAALVILPGCYSFDSIFPWTWHVPKLKKHEQLKGEEDVEQKKQKEAAEKAGDAKPGTTPGTDK